MRARMLLLLALAALIAAIPAAHAQTITLASDGGLVAPFTPTIIHVNMTQALNVTATTVYVVVNVTIPQGFELLYMNVTYNTTAAQPVEIKWDPASRNITVNVSVTSLPYNDLNLTLVLLPVSTSASGTIAATYYYNQSTSYTVLLSASASLSVNATAVPAPYKPMAEISYGYSMLCVTIAGGNEAYAMLQLLNDVQLSYVNGTLLNDTVLCVAGNETLASSIPLLNISMPEYINASFGANTTTAAPAGLVLVSLPVYDLEAPTSGSLEVAGVLGSTTTINYMEVNASNAFLVGGSASEVHLNATTYMLVYGAVVTDLYLNATANNTEADILSSNVTGTLELVNASGVTGAEAYIAFSYVPAKYTSDTGWGTPTIVLSDTSILGNVYGSSGLLALIGVYGTPSASYATVAVTLPPSTGSNTILYKLELGYDKLDAWYTGNVTPAELAGILVKSSYAEQTEAYIYATIPSGYVASYQENVTLPSASTVLAVAVGTGGASTRMYCCSGPVTSFAANVSSTNPVMLYLAAPAHKPAIEVAGTSVGNELVVVEADVGPSILLPGAFNVTLESNATGATLTAAMVNLTGSSLSYTGTPIVVSRLYGGSSSGVYNATIVVYPPSGGVLYDGLKVYYELLVPNETTAYNLTLREYFVSNATPVEMTLESSTVYSVSSYARMMGVYVPTPRAAMLYLPLLAAVYNITPVSYVGYGAAYAGNSTFTPYGKLLLLTDLPKEYAPLIEVKVATADGRFALIGVGGVREVNASIVNVTVPVKTCFINVKLYADNAVEVNSTSGYIPMVKIVGSEVEAPVVAVNASTFTVKDSSVSGNVSLAAEYDGVVVGGSLAGNLTVVNGTVYVFYANLSGVTSVSAATTQLKVYLPVAYSGVVAPYLVEPVTVAPLAKTVASATGATSATAKAGRVTVTVEFTTAPTTPTYVVAAQLAPTGAMKPPVKGSGSISVADVAVVGATPSKVYVTLPVAPSACIRYTASQIASMTKFYVYNATLGQWVEVKPASVTVNTAYCTVTAEFNATSTPPASAFTGVPVAAFTPTPLRVVGVNVYPFRYAVAAAESARLVYAALAALLATLLAVYLAARRL